MTNLINLCLVAAIIAEVIIVCGAWLAAVKRKPEEEEDDA